MRARAWCLIGLWAGVLLAGCGKPEEAPPPPVVASASAAPEFDPEAWAKPIPPVRPGAATLVRFVAINGCVLCERIDGMLRDLEKKHGAALAVERYDSATPGAKKYLRSLDMRRHGVVIYDKAAAPLWVNDSHSLDRASLETAVDAVVKGAKPPPPPGEPASAASPSCAASACAPSASPAR